MPNHDEKRVLPYSCEQMFDLVASIDKYPEFLPWCLGARIKEKSDERVIADLIIGYKVFRERFTSIVTLNRPHKISVQYQSGPLSRLSNEWEFRPVGKDCEVSFQVDFDFRSPLLSTVIDAFFDRALSKMVAAFEARAVQLYGAKNR